MNEELECITGELLEINPKKRHYIYLAGNISEDPRTYAWREEFIELLADEPGVVMINPCKNDFDQDMKTAGKGGIEFIKEAIKNPNKVRRSRFLDTLISE